MRGCQSCATRGYKQDEEHAIIANQSGEGTDFGAGISANDRLR